MPGAEWRSGSCLDAPVFAGLNQTRDAYSGVLVDDREVVPAGIPGEPARAPEAACHACTVTTVGPSTRVQRRLPT